MVDLVDTSRRSRRVTSACGVGIYRDHWLGAEFHGNAFTCEPVANVVRRTVLDTGGVVHTGVIAAEKIKIARRLRSETTMTWGWIAAHLHMGSVGYAAQCLRQR